MKPNIKIYRQNRRNLMMRLVPGAIEVFIPHQLDKQDPFVQEFIAEGLERFDGNIPELPPEITPKETIRQMVNDYAKRMGVKASRVQFRDMHRKWGSCSSRGTVTLNSRLTWLESHLAEYIVCHELAHLIELNHSKRYWKIVKEHMPDYKNRLQELRRVEKNLW